MILATAGGLVALAAAWIFLGPGGFGGPHLSFMEKGKVEELIAALPDQGPVFPEFSGSKKGQLLRGDGSSLEVEGILKKLQTRVKEGRVNSEDFFWLVSAELAMGKTDMARLHLKEWHAETDTRFMNLKGILAYQESDLTAAETEFREILQEHANEADAEFNLSLVLIAKGDITGARDGLERVLNGKDSQLSERARTVIVSLPH
jgi:thioredoxin-like negative regulator of GroEL